MGWGGVGWGGDSNKPWRLTRTWGHITLAGCSVVSNLLVGGLGWGGVGWGGDNNKPWRLTRTWGHTTLAGCSVVSNLLVGGLGWGGVGVGTVTNLAALHGPEDYAGRLLICINIFLWVGWGGVGWGQQQALPPHRDLTTTLGGFSCVQISSFGWVGLGRGWVGTITNLGALPGHEDTSHWPDVKLYQIFLWVGWGGVGWGGVGWGGVNNKPGRPTRTWRLRWAAPHLYKHLVMGGLGWGGAGTITSLAALQGPDDYAGRLFICTNIFFTFGWVGLGWGWAGTITNLGALHGPDNYAGRIFICTKVGQG